MSMLYVHSWSVESTSSESCDLSICVCEIKGLFTQMNLFFQTSLRYMYFTAQGQKEIIGCDPEREYF